MPDRDCLLEYYLPKDDLPMIAHTVEAALFGTQVKLGMHSLPKLHIAAERLWRSERARELFLLYFSKGNMQEREQFLRDLMDTLNDLSPRERAVITEVAVLSKFCWR
jgi:hypothetical protein